MINPFSDQPQGVQPAPHDVRLVAAGYQVAVREVDFGAVRDKDTLMLAFLAGLGLTQNFGRNWDALYDVLTDPSQRPARFALMLCDYARFRRRAAALARELEAVLFDAQNEAARQGRSLWLLAEEPESDTGHW
jgi:RNAse (barnase) inhibitor barstar